jgi:hypothetical protein
MNRIPSAPVQVPPEVAAYSEKYGVAQHLEPFCRATLQMFPTAVDLRLSLQDDLDIRDLTFVVVALQVPLQDVPNYVEAVHRWDDEFYRSFPPPYQCPFVLHLERV